MCRKLGPLFLAIASIPWMFSGAVRADDKPAYDRKEDVVYGRKFGTALTLDVFTPKANATIYRYSQQKPSELAQEPFNITNPAAAIKVTLPPMSISLLVLDSTQK